MYGLRYYCFSLYVLHPSVIFSFITVAMHCLLSCYQREMEIVNPLPCTDSALHYCDALQLTA